MLFALGMFLYSLEPAENPLKNELNPVHRFKEFIDDSEGIDTDPGLALKTRKGTGLYKIPSLRSLWYRGSNGHAGSVSSLEDWFDPKRLGDNYVPSGWKLPGITKRALPGHEFGLDLSPDEKNSRIAFLKTL